MSSRAVPWSMAQNRRWPQAARGRVACHVRSKRPLCNSPNAAGIACPLDLSWPKMLSVPRPADQDEVLPLGYGAKAKSAETFGLEATLYGMIVPTTR